MGGLILGALCWRRPLVLSFSWSHLESAAGSWSSYLHNHFYLRGPKPFFGAEPFGESILFIFQDFLPKGLRTCEFPKTTGLACKLKWLGTRQKYPQAFATSPSQYNYQNALCTTIQYLKSIQNPPQERLHVLQYVAR